MTGAGVILGTAAYMSPEQAKGREADRRSDVWSFGCVLFEMLTGRRAFDGENVGETLAAVIRGEPEWAALPPELPPSIRLLLKQCLEKEPRLRVSDLAVAKFLMSETASSLSAPLVASKDSSYVTARGIALGVLAGIALTLAAGWGAVRLTQPSRPADPARFAIATPQALADSVAQDIALSPDGRHILYVVALAGGTQLAVRAVGELEPRLLAGTEGASSPFFSPDGSWIGFFNNTGGGGGELKRMPIAGGQPMPVCRYKGNAAGASWGADDFIVFATTDQATGLFRVSSSGGEPSVLTTPDRDRGEIDHRFPFVLPGENAVLYSRASVDLYDVEVFDLRTGRRRSLVSGGRNAQYVDTGHMVYAVGESLRAVAFDPGTQEVKGDPVPVLQDVRVEQAVMAAADFSVSRNGVLVYVPGSADRLNANRSLVWVTRDGAEEAIRTPARAFIMARLSPDGKKVALDVREDQADIWLLDLARESFSRLTTDPRNDRNPLWMPDGERIAFASNRTGLALSLFWQRADGIGEAEQLATATGFMVPTSVSPDGTRIALMENNDITLVTIDPAATKGGPGRVPASASAGETRRSRPLLATAFSEDNAEVSPDGRWLAYQSNESGQNQIYVRSFPDPDRFRMPVTTAGGRAPAWSRNGRELFYLDGSNMLTSVPVTPGDTLSAGKPAQLLRKTYFAGFGNRPYDVSADGRRFLMIKQPEAAEASVQEGNLIVVLNWQEELKRLVPVN